MGRRLPTKSDPLLHPAVLSLSLHVVWMAAVVAVVASLCGNRSKKSSNTAEDENAETIPVTTATVPDTAPEEKAQEQESQTDPSTDEVPLYPLPLPQSLLPLPEGHRVPAIKSASTRHLKVSLSMKVPSKLSRIRTTAHKNKKAEDCIWKKTIILGEKCRVPSGGEEEDIICDDKVNKTVPYTPRTPRSLPVSRSVSLIDQEAVPVKNS